MAQLPPDGDWLIQQIGGQVVLFHRWTEEEIVRFDPADSEGIMTAQRVIDGDPRLDDKAKAYAHFWSGYFYSHSRL